MYSPGANSSPGQIAERSWSKTLRYVLPASLFGMALLDAAYYLHSKRMYRPASPDPVITLNAIGGIFLLSAGVAILMAAAVKAGRRLSLRFHRAAETVLAVVAFVLASGLGLLVMQRIYREYELLEAEALASRGVTVTARIEGRQFHRSKAPYFDLFFRVRNESGEMQRISFIHHDKATVADQQFIRVRYLPANPLIYRRLDRPD
jgi:hypothetical protein